MIDRIKPLTGLLWLRSGGHDFSLPLAGVRRVALCNQLRVARSTRTGLSWWHGVTLDEGKSHPLLNLAELVGVPAGRLISPDSVVVFAYLWDQSVGLVCDRFRGIIPAGQPSWPLSHTLFASGDGALPGVRLWSGRPVIDLALQHLFSTQGRTQFDHAMKNSKENVDQLWELSELEQQLTANPTVQGYQDLAARYLKLGWTEEAERMLAKAAEVKLEAPNTRSSTNGLSGPLNRRVLLELLQVLHLTGKSGELLLEALDGIAGAVSFRGGAIVAVRCGDTVGERTALQQLATINAGRYQFLPGVPAESDRSKSSIDTTALIAGLEQEGKGA